MVDIAAQQESRKLKPIYDALDTGSYKLAIQICNKLLKKQSNYEVVKALKALALLRSNKLDESLSLTDEVLSSKPTDETVLGVMSHVLKHLDRAGDIIAMFEEAFKKQPSNEELGSQTFMAMIRVGGWKNAQVIAFKLYKQFKVPRYLFWSIMAAVLQAQNAGANGGPPNPAEEAHTPILLNLALRLMNSSPLPSHITADHFILHLTILRSLDRNEDAYNLVNSEKGQALCDTSLVVDEFRRELYVSCGANKEEVALCRRRLEKGDRNWLTFMSFIDSTFRTISQANDPNTQSTAKSAEKGSGEADGRNVDPELTPKPTQKDPIIESPLDPKVVISEAKEFLAKLAEKDGFGERGSHMALLHLEKSLRLYNEGKDNSPDLLESMKDYFIKFSDRACCFEDVKPYAGELCSTSSELSQWISFLEEQRSACNPSLSLRDLQKTINVYKLLRYSSEPLTEEEENQLALDFVRMYHESLSLGNNLGEKELQPADDLALLACNALVSAWTISQNFKHLLKALVILEYASSRSKQNYQFRVLAIRLYRLLGANGPALDHYRLLDIKQVQTDTLSHLILSRGSTFSLATNGDIGMMTECINASDIYQQNSNDTADLIVRAFQHEKYSQITEFVEFEDRLDNSLQRDLTRLEYVRMKAATEKIENDGLLAELHELEFVFEKMHHDNRDYTVIPNYQRRGQQIADQTSMGTPQGFQWLTVFLQLYIRAYSRAAKVETLAATDLNIFRSSWLSEMTEEEKDFLAFSQILHDWIPCPVLEPRESVLVAGDASVKPTELQVHGPPPHVKQDGSEPLKVEASSETAVKFFQDFASRVDTAIKNGKLLWEILHLATLAQEAFVLLQIASFPYLSGGKNKKNDHPIVESLKSVKSQAANYLKDIAKSLTKFADSEGTSGRRKEFVQMCQELGKVAPELHDDYILNIAKSFTDSRKVVTKDVGKGIIRVVENA
ncbi:hypothetical protein FRC03_001380 [Tulasnella sp. 419]|nr:hypothetical protein FRC03_001380 [Tulasnella sp. 419]